MPHRQLGEAAWLMLLEVQFAASAAGYEHNHVHEQMSYRLA